MSKLLNKSNMVDMARKEAEAMRKDISVPTELNLREQMSIAVLLEYAEYLFNTKSASEVKTIFTTMATELQASHFVANTFIETAVAQFNELSTNKQKVTSKIKERFLHSPKVCKAFESFADPNLALKTKEIMDNKVIKPYVVLNATADMYLDNVIEHMKNVLKFDHEFIRQF